MIVLLQIWHLLGWNILKWNINNYLYKKFLCVVSGIMVLEDFLIAMQTSFFTSDSSLLKHGVYKCYFDDIS